MRSMGIGLAVAAATLLLCSSLPAAPRAVDDLIEQLPADTVAIAVVRLHELQASPVYREFEQRFAFGHGLGLDEFVGMTGVDPEHNIESFVIGVRAADQKRKRRAVGLVRGRFDPERITASLDEAGTERDSRGYYSLHEPSDGVLRIVSPELLVFGERSSVASLVDGGDDLGRLSADSGLRQAFAAAGTEGQIWGSVSLDDMLPLQDVNRELSPPLAAIRTMEWASFELDFADDLSLSLTGVAETEEEATLVQQAIQGMLALGKLAAREYPDRLALLNEVVVERDGDRITVALTLPGS